MKTVNEETEKFDNLAKLHVIEGNLIISYSNLLSNSFDTTRMN